MKIESQYKELERVIIKLNKHDIKNAIIEYALKLANSPKLNLKTPGFDIWNDYDEHGKGEGIMAELVFNFESDKQETNKDEN